MSIRPQVIEKHGKKEFVVLPYEEFLAMKEALEDYEDLKDLREAKVMEADEPSTPLSKVRADLLSD
ncbi:MAG: type II toxin-antitoxin system Phd/YefM family antitoxin [Opitutales bacterium]|nr:type II toxin-antitoxin system Phd/YefM family antitoxin [Opitutales bacterium]